MKKAIFLVPLVLLFTTPLQAQILKDIKDRIAGLTVDKLSKDPITTSFKDVDKNNIQPASVGATATYANLHAQPFSPETGFTLTPGYYEAEVMSFCIKAGTYMPTKGSGRFYAALKGPKADIFEAILTALHTDRTIERKDVQLLLWAIIAKTDFKKMKGPVKVTALKILNAKQIARLSKGALDNIAQKKLKKLAYKNDALRAIIEAENNLRYKFYKGASSYAEFEEIAMLAGVEPIVTGYETGKWSKHPDGYFVRYYPSGYSHTRTQVYVPEQAGSVIYNAYGSVAVPASTGGQRLLQTNIPWNNDTWSYGGPTSQDNEEEEEEIQCSLQFNAAADAAIKKQMIMQNIPGLAVAVFQNGKITHIKGYGYSDVFKKTPITTETIMHWASISKSVTAVAAMQLNQDAEIEYDINDLVTSYANYWPQSVNYTATNGQTGTDTRHASVRVRHLLQNRGGINHYGSIAEKKWTMFGTDTVRFANSGGYQAGTTGYNAPSAVGKFNASVLGFAPGSNYSYTTYGFNLLGATIEEASPNGYVDWIQNNIADVANMDSFQVAREKREGHTMRADGVLKIATSTGKESVLPGGGWESNICDMAKYAIGLSQGDFFDQTQNSMWDVNNSTSFTDGTRYGYGVWFMGRGAKSRVWHGGMHGNLRSFMHFFPSDTTGIVIISPAVYAELPHLARRVYKAMEIRNSLYKDRKHIALESCRTNMISGNDLFNTVWRKNNKDVIIRTGIENDSFFEEVQRLRTAGYQCKDFQPFMEGNVRYWDGVFQKGHAQTKMWRNASKNAFVAKSAEMKDNGYRLLDLETYLDGNGKRLWAGIFKRTNDGYSVRLDRTTTKFAEVRKNEQEAGKKLIDVEVYLSNGKLMWNGVFSQGNPNLLNRNMTIEEFDRIQLNRLASGHKLIDIEYYEVNGNWKVAAIWEKVGDAEELTTLMKFCDTMKKQDSLSAIGYELIDWNRLPNVAD